MVTAAYNEAAMASAAVHGLYVIVDPNACSDRDAVEVARLALEGGAAMLQWRDKHRDKGDQIADARAIRNLCREHGALFIVNDHVDLALAVGADGVHLGQHDLPAAEARTLVPESFLLGVSTNNVEEAQRAEADGASYVAVGSIFATDTKEITRPASPDTLRQVKRGVGLPVVAIGGIDAANVAEVVAAGADAVAVISAVCSADDVRAAARELRTRIAP